MLCSDKTGTLTQNKLTLGDSFSVKGVTADQVILYRGASIEGPRSKDTIDLAVIGGVKGAATLKAYQILHFSPFDPVHKRTEATREERGRQDILCGQGCTTGHSGNGRPTPAR